MKSIKHIALSIVLTLSVFGAVLYTSCSKSACKAVTCLNNGTCSGGTCVCPSGIGGNNCETVYRKIYSGNYKGFATYTDTNHVVIRTDTNNSLTFLSYNDSNYTKMQMQWSRPGSVGAITRITLSNNTASGSSFSVEEFLIDSFIYTGSGSINANTVSINLIATPPHSPSIIVTLNNFSRQ